MHRDSFASYIGHSGMVLYFALAENEAVGRRGTGAALHLMTPAGLFVQLLPPWRPRRVKFNLMQKMLLPCGVPPAKKAEEE